MVNITICLIIVLGIMDYTLTPFIQHYLNLPEVDRRRIYTVSNDGGRLF